MPIVGLVGGVALTVAHSLVVIILGVAVITATFFAAHSTASGWVGRRATRDRAQASSLYLLFYYLGSSILGSAGGLAWNAGGWPAVSFFCIALALVALVIAIHLIGVRPLGEMPVLNA
jgi:YNFM family putative membrane transporter